MISDVYNSNDVPPHTLKLKVGDICLIMRNLNVNEGFTNNTRIVILKLTRQYITCQTLGPDPEAVILPRIRFNFRLPFGQSFTMSRLQFPLRRAFCLSIHKSQARTDFGACAHRRQRRFLGTWTSLCRHVESQPLATTTSVPRTQ